MNSFVHLHVHSEYSLLDGAARMDELAVRAAACGMKALALTDHGVMYGIIPFYKACIAQGVKPIIGMEAYVTTRPLHEKGARKEQPIFHLILLAKNDQGYRNLMKICSIGHLEGFYDRPCVDMNTLRQYADGIIALSACLKGEVSQHVLHGRMEEAREAVERYRDMFRAGFYIELQDQGLSEQQKVNIELIALSERTGVPIVATNDVHYVEQADASVQDALICIGTGENIDEEHRFRMDTDQFYFKSQAEMTHLFCGVPEAIANTARIAEQCTVKLDFGGHVLPAYHPLPKDQNANQFLRQLCEEGLEGRYALLPEWQEETFRGNAKARLDYELSTIEHMGFSDYFLIVWDFVRFAHERGIMTGPGRGSSAGSLVAYCLRITNVDPLKYHLLFERFLNPERVTMPDIDIDFNDERRDEVIRYVADKYGRDRVAQIITFGTMAARAAVRDVGRVLNIPAHETDRVAKMIPNQLGMTLELALRSSHELSGWRERSAHIRELMDMAMKVEGLPRHTSTHAAGVMISGEPLTHYVPLQAGTESIALTQYPMESLESLGMLKMDFLGLRTLSIIERTLTWISLREAKPLNLEMIDDGDRATYALLCRGDTIGVFQLESAGVRKVLRDLKPSVFEDIISVLALYRPGPMKFIPDYIQSKHGWREVEYPHPALKPILQHTYGIIVYQEQIIHIASKMAGFSLGEADLLRRAMSKKKREILDRERCHFVDGSLRQGYTAKEANGVYDMIVRFADYGFPRSHAAAYGVLAFQTAYLKAHYPIEFMAAVLTANMGSQRKIAKYIEDCRRLGIPVMSPDVNESFMHFTPGDGTIRFGLGAIKNVGTQAIENILIKRKEKRFTDLLDFCQRVDFRVCNRRVIESLIQTGAFDSLPGHRAQLLAMLDETLNVAAKWCKERESLQVEWIGFMEVSNWTVEYPDIPPFSVAKQLDLERERLGLYLSAHPLDQDRELLASLETDRLIDLHEVSNGSECVVAVLIVSLRSIRTKKGRPMAFMEVEDRTERAEVVLFPEVWHCSERLIKKGAIVVLQAKVQRQDEGYSLLASEVVPFDSAAITALMKRSVQHCCAQEAPQRTFDRTGVQGSADCERVAISSNPSQPSQHPRIMQTAQRQCVYIKITAHHERPKLLQNLKQLLKSHPGPLPTILFYEREQKFLALSEAYALKPSPELFKCIEAIFGPGTVRVK